MRVIVLLSGGVDSVTVLYKMHRQETVSMALSFDYGSKHNEREIVFARYHTEKLGIPHRVVSLGFMQDYRSDLLLNGGDIPQGSYCEANMQSTVVPFRNGIMLAIAAGYAESMDCEAIAIASHSGDHALYPDCRPEFTQAMEKAICNGTYNGVRLLAPFIHTNKGDIVKEGIRLGIDYARTWSCYCGGEVHCGKCGTCRERKEAFRLAGSQDPTQYLE